MMNFLRLFCKSALSNFCLPRLSAIYEYKSGDCFVQWYSSDSTVPRNTIEHLYAEPAQTNNGRVYDKKPFKIRLYPNKRYHWCLCGMSKTQPMCDGTHKVPLWKCTIKPVPFEVAEEKDYWLCNCKQTKLRPFCDVDHLACPNGNPASSWDMNHKHNRYKNYQEDNSDDKSFDNSERKESRNTIKEKQEFIKMASEMKAAASTELDDEVTVLYDKMQDHRSSCPADKTLFKNKVEQCSVRLEDIPLPPDNWLPKKTKINDSQAQGVSQSPRDGAVNPLPSSPEIEIMLKVTGREGTNSSSSIQSTSCTRFCGFKDEVESMKKEVYGFRKWEHIDSAHFKGETQETRTRNSASFTIMSYNVLAQELLETHQYLYQNHDHRCLSWAYRKEVLFKEIQEANPDVLCLQEVQHNHLELFRSRLRNQGFTLGLYKQRTNGKVDGCAIFYKKQKFKLIDSTSVEFYQYYKPELSILDRDNVAIIARLQYRGMQGSDYQIVIATTHLLYNPRRHDIKLAQTQVLLAEVERMAFINVDSVKKLPKYWPIILTGDFNLEPGSAVYRFLSDGSLKYSDLAARTLSVPAHGQPHQDVLLPEVLQISSKSQHLHLLQRRNRLRHLSEARDSRELKFLKIYNSDLYESLHHFSKLVSRTTMNANEWVTGNISHTFDLKSVYSHQRLAQNGRGLAYEATTHQKGWVTVDYIFYSKTIGDESRLQQLVKGSLKLLSRYSLPTRDQCHRLQHLPNLVCGSDHLPLIAKFLLTPDPE